MKWLKILLHSFFWEYGVCKYNKKARRHRFKKNVQFVLWKKGQHNHKKDFWIDYDSSHWDKFKKEKL